MRGKDCRSADNVQRIRITPRLCGEKASAMSLSSRTAGSPPPMRGKVHMFYDRISAGRITPAYAGKSADSMPCTILLQDHPRLCGEKVQGVWQCLSIKGSPPPMRGKVLHSDWAAAGYGITPAYAGKSKTKKEKHKI